MSFARIDDNYLDHPKCLEAGEDAAMLNIRAIVYCNKHLTDGRLPKSALSSITRKPKPELLVKDLVRVNLWEDHGDHWLLHDFLDWNESRSEVLTRRAAVKDRKKRWTERQAGTRSTDGDGTRSERVRNATSERGSDAPLSSPLLSSPIETGTPHSPPAAAAAGEPSRKARQKRQRPPDVRVDAVRADVLRLSGVDYPDAAWDGLRAQFGKGTSLDDALAYVRWCAAQPWERDTMRLDPTVLFRHARFVAGAAKARAPAATGPPRSPRTGTLRAEDAPAAAFTGAGDITAKF